MRHGNEFHTLIDMLRERAAVKGAALAFTYLADGERREQPLSYENLDSRASQIGAALAAYCRPGERALLLYPPGLEFVEAFFGCLYGGVVAVPAYPPDPVRLARTLPRLQAIASDAEATTVLTTAPLLEMAQFLFAQAPELGRLRWLATDSLPGDGSDWTRPDVGPQTLAFLQYTSGSTGTPKGVMLTHGNLLHNEQLIQHAFNHDEQSVVVGWLPQYHDMGLIGNVLQPLYSGGCCVLMSPLDFLQRPMRWLRAISHYRGTTSGGPNFAYDLCVRKSTEEERAQLDLSCWRLAFTGAEPVRAETMARFVAAFARCGFASERFYPCYGLAESSLLVTGGAASEPPVFLSISAAALEQGVALAVSGPDSKPFVGCGRAVDDEEVLVVDPEARVRCTDDRVGEVWVRSPSVAQGYFHKEALSEETFGAKLSTGEGPFLRTGDLGFLHDGELFITGRRKDLIIIRGRNLYPQDIEATVAASHSTLRPGCTAAFSVDEGGEERLVVVQEIDRKADDAQVGDAVSAIRAAVAEQHEVSPYAVALIEPGSIAKTSSGKIQRHASKAAFLAGTLAVRRVWRSGADRPPSDEREVAVEGPVGALEAELTGLLSTCLGMESGQLDPTRSLSAYGLDSLGAIEAQAAIEDKFGKRVALSVLLSGPTVRELAQRVDEQPHSLADVTAPTKENATRSLSVGQEALWLLDELEPDSSAHHIAAAFTLPAGVDVDALDKAVSSLVAHHPQLRSTIELEDGRPRWRVHETARPGTFRRETIADTASFSSAEAGRRFDLGRDGPLRVVLLEGARPRLLVVLHHIATDLWSMALFARELGEAYAAARVGGAPPWHASVDFDLAAEQARHATSSEGAASLSYWTERLRGWTPLALPADHPRRKQGRRPASTVAMTIEGSAYEGLRALAGQREVTLFSVLLAAYAVLLSRYASQRDVVVGVPMNGRGAGRTAVLGYLVNVLPLRLDVRGQESFGALVERARALTVDALVHQGVPLARIVGQLGLETDRGGGLVRTILAFQKLPAALEGGIGALALGRQGVRLDLGGLVLESEPTLPVDAQFDLSVAFAEADGQLLGLFTYDTTLFERDTIKRMAKAFTVLVEEVARDPDRPLSELPLLPDEERERLLHEWNDMATAYEPELVHELFAAQAARTPNARAVVCENEQLTYRELDERSNQLGHYLNKRGVGPDVLVALCVERSLEMVVGLLGILKAGGAYVPLDPKYPAERLAYTTVDSKAQLLLTQEQLLGSLPVSEAEVLCLDRDWAEVAEEPTSAPSIHTSPANLAYVIYTSGSTGRPKGVAIAHRSAAALVRWAKETYSAAELGRGAVRNVGVLRPIGVRAVRAVERGGTGAGGGERACARGV